MFSPPHGRRGQGLIELLVGMSTLSVTVGLLVPAFAQSREVSLRQAELGNLRTIINLAHTYAERDPTNILGPIHPSALQFSGEGYAEYGGGPGDMNFVGWNDSFDPQTRAFNRLLYGSEMFDRFTATAPGDRSVFKEFQCLGQDLGWQRWPGFFANPLETERSYFQANGTSFRQNNLTFGFGSSLGIYAHAAQDIPAPSQTLAYMEARAYQTLWTNEVWGALGGPAADIFGELVGNHKKRGFFMVSYVDGHAGLVDFGHGTYFEHQDPSGLDVRGTWGRMDTLPVPGTANARSAGQTQAAIEPNVNLVREN